MNLPQIDLVHGDCLNWMQTAGRRVDFILTDPPFGITQASWDNRLDFAAMWTGIERVLRPGGCCAFFASQPFAAELILSNTRWFSCDLVWHKNKATGHLNAGSRPLVAHEYILIFHAPYGQRTYNPEMRSAPRKRIPNRKTNQKLYGDLLSTPYDSTERYPRTVLEFPVVNESEKRHPTEKPVALLRYLIRMWSNRGDGVLDICMGSGSTGEAAYVEGRDFTGIEIDEKWFQVAQSRLTAEGIQTAFC